MSKCAAMQRPHKTRPDARVSRKGLPRRFTPVVFALYMSAIMSLLMCLVITAATGGWGRDYLATVGDAYLLAMPVAFLCVLAVRPLVMRLVSWTIAGDPP